MRNWNIPKSTASLTASGFTLAELLIALAILGVIATFTIPKILHAQQGGQNVAIAKEAAASLSGAIQQHRLRGLLNSGTLSSELMQYLNYVKSETSGTIDDRPNLYGSLNCSVAAPCYRLHNGAVIQPFDDNSGNLESFGGTTALHYVSFTLDPDGQTTGNEDSIRFLLYYDGRITDRNNALPGSVNVGGTIGPVSNANPAWFSW